MEVGDKVIRVLALVIAGLLLASVEAAAKMPDGSFLNSPVTSVNELSQQVIDDAIVAVRYAKHFNMPRNLVVDYFQSNMQIGKLKVDYEATVYVIDKDGQAVPTQKTLPAGSYAFVTRNGIPILEGATGNPLIQHLPILLSTNTEGTPSTVVPVDSGQAASGLVDGVITKVLGSDPIELQNASVLISPTADSTTTAVASIVEIVPAIPVSAVKASTGLSKLVTALPIAAVLGGAAFAGGGSSPSPPPNGSPVPEPSSLATLAFAASAIGFSALRRRL